ncbi:hypothetical protein DV704_03350 [Meiothermus sp. QL-1]|uniref:hypothetical protein n=1 Tax=Meiothermus sp. QL-1 TaxID=2058095 RepID=UPI000E0BBFE8|nr:hypothetical protein [Meiothermus sp. QL-1]RDI95970.1 hypothetical protein DV704_03350 [Meiothermus sp. QL-1]
MWFSRRAFGGVLAWLALGLAWATPCRDQPYTLETPEGLAGGGNLEFDGEVALFSDGACLETPGLTLSAPSLRYDQASGVLEAQAVEVETPRYRLWAAEARVQGRILQAANIRATPCRCGDDLRLLAQTLHFDTESGEVLLEESRLEAYRFGLAQYTTLRLEPNRPLAASLGLDQLGNSSPIRFDFDQGMNLGLSEFPLLGLPAAPRLTLLGLGLGGPDPTLRFGFSVREENRRASFQFDAKASSPKSQSEMVDGPLFFTHNSELGRYAFGLQASYPNLRLFGHIAQDWPDGTPASQVRGVAAGAELRYPLALAEGPFRLRLEPFGLLTFYDQGPAYWAYGGRLEGRFEGDFALRLGYTWVESPTQGRFWLERREAARKLDGGLSLPGFDLEAERDLLKAQTQTRLRLGLQQPFGELWAQFQGCFDCVGKTLSNGRDDWERRELVLGFSPRPLECTFDLSLAPSIGYDFLRQGISRAGLELRYADCCFVWRLGYQAVYIAQHPDETPGSRLVFGLEIR